MIVVDRTRAAFLCEGEDFYLKRLKRYARMEWIQTRPSRIKKGKSTRQILDEEAGDILKRLSARDYVIVLDRQGRTYDSEKLSQRMSRLSQFHSEITFVIGGPLGLSSKVLERANETISLSKLTLTHEMSRLFLLEQLYRGFTIINGEKYHK